MSSITATHSLESGCNLMSGSSHIRHVLKLEIVVELYLLLTHCITVLVKYHSKNDFFEQGLTVSYLDFLSDFFPVRK